MIVKPFVTKGRMSHVRSVLSIELVNTNEPQFERAIEVIVSVWPRISVWTWSPEFVLRSVTKQSTWFDMLMLCHFSTDRELVFPCVYFSLKKTNLLGAAIVNLDTIVNTGADHLIRCVVEGDGRHLVFALIFGVKILFTIKKYLQVVNGPAAARIPQLNCRIVRCWAY